MTDLTHIAGTGGRIWLDGGAVRVATMDGERELSTPADLELPPPPPLTGDPRNARQDWQAMAYAEIAPYTELCKSMKALIRGEAAPSPVTPATFADGLANMQVMDAIRASAAQGGVLVQVG